MQNDNILSILYKMLQQLASLNHYLKTNETIISGYISGLGSFLGGIIGATVSAFIAFKISKSQIKADRQKDIYYEKIRQRNYLFSLIHEIKHNCKIYEFLSKQATEEIIFSLETYVWESVRFESSNFVDAEQYEIIETFYREVKDIKNKVVNDIYKIDYSTRCVTLSKSIENLNKKLIILDDEIKTLNRIND